tara:strand:- start:93 stop:296 length:204 start_codon:yes stop_codon:yes gene_type:complete
VTHGLRKRRSIKNTVQLLRDYNSFVAALAATGSMTPESWALLYKLHERTNKQISVLAERPSKEEIES